MNDIRNLSLEEKEIYFKNIYDRKCKFVGPKNSVVEKVKIINKNLKSNPDKLAVCEGVQILMQASSLNMDIKYLIVCLEYVYSIESQKIIQKHAVEHDIYFVSKKVFDSIAEKGNSNGIIGIVQLPKANLKQLLDRKKNGLYIVLDAVEIPGNVGTILRAADGVGADAVILVNRKVRFSHPKLIRSSLGACFTVPMIEMETEELQDLISDVDGDLVLADTRQNMPFFKYNYEGNTFMVMGSEVYGISKSWYDFNFTGVFIPMQGSCDSLNVGVATSILIYEAGMKKNGLLKR